MPGNLAASPPPLALFVPPPSRFAVLAALLAALGVAGCQPSSPATVRDDLGRTVTIDGRPRAVVPLAPNITELVAAAAGIDRLAGVARSDNFPAGVAALPRFQSLPLDVEALVALDPDLVIGSDDVTPTDAADGLAALNLPTYLFRFDEVADVPRALRTLDTLLAVTGGAAVAADFERRVEAVQSAVAPYDRQRVLLLVGSEEGVLYAFGRDSYASELIRLAGAENLTDLYEGAAAQPSVEAILDLAPQVIIGAGDLSVESLLADHPALFETPAVQNRRVYGIDADLVLRPGPRLVDGLERIARLLHPEAFAAGVA